jgi:hypothetical protein
LSILLEFVVDFAGSIQNEEYNEWLDNKKIAPFLQCKPCPLVGNLGRFKGFFQL